MEMTRSIRNYRIDNLRAIGILMIILAHCNAPVIVNSIRCFDVILLVFISAYMYKESSPISKEVYKKYLVKKVNRLLVPTYVFVVGFSLFLYVGYRLVGRGELFGVKQIINSFLLCEDSVGYVWIMKVYLVNALLAPAVVWLLSKLKSVVHFIAMLIIEISLYLLFLWIYQTWLSGSYFAWVILNEWLLCCMAYGIIGQVALWHKSNAAWKKMGWILWLIVFSITCVYHGGFFTAAGKRPANVHYLSWGLLTTELLFLLVPNMKNRPLQWLSKNSLQLYFIHPFYIFAFSVGKNVLGFNGQWVWIAEWIVVLLLAVLTVLIIGKIKNCIL